MSDPSSVEDGKKSPYSNLSSDTADGRSLRASRTRLAITDALLELIHEGDLMPTAKRVAIRAGVSERSIFQHFPVLEELFRIAAQRQFEKIYEMVEQIDPELDLDTRIELFVKQRCRILEEISPVRAASLLQEPFSREIKKSRHRAIEESNLEIRYVFSKELRQLSAKDAKDLIVRIDAVTSWNLWEHLKFQGYSSERCFQMILELVKSSIYYSLGPKT